jgi:hypothetical protein
MQLRREKIALLCGVRWGQQKPIMLPQRLVQKKLSGKGQALQAIVASIAHSGRMLYWCPNRFVNSKLGMAVKGVDAVALDAPATILGGQEAFLSPRAKVLLAVAISSSLSPFQVTRLSPFAPNMLSSLIFPPFAVQMKNSCPLAVKPAQHPNPLFLWMGNGSNTDEDSGPLTGITRSAIMSLPQF